MSGGVGFAKNHRFCNVFGGSEARTVEKTIGFIMFSGVPGGGFATNNCFCKLFCVPDGGFVEKQFVLYCFLVSGGGGGVL